MSLPFAVLMLCSLPVLLTSDNVALVLLYTLLPLYMFHQYEEHAHGKFVDFFNSTVGRGCPVLTKSSAFLINVLGVWLVFFVSFYLAKYVALGVVFVPVYLVLVNAVTHLVTGIRLRRYNPGLYTSILLFLPWGSFLAIYFGYTVQSSLLFGGVGLLVAIIEHAIIVVYATARRNALESSP